MKWMVWRNSCPRWEKEAEYWSTNLGRSCMTSSPATKSACFAFSESSLKKERWKLRFSLLMRISLNYTTNLPALTGPATTSWFTAAEKGYMCTIMVAIWVSFISRNMSLSAPWVPQGALFLLWIVFDLKRKKNRIKVLLV